MPVPALLDPLEQLARLFEGPGFALKRGGSHSGIDGRACGTGHVEFVIHLLKGVMFGQNLCQIAQRT